ncbi:MAG: TRAP transporter large permease [Deltaproteobacteria bacterium]|nr:MAG: TRAP transporter large permease [Deltaproteobacteria bacterium]
MEWWVFLTLIVGAFLLLLAAGLPVFLAFIIVDVLGIYFLWGGAQGLCQLIHSIFSSISTFVLLPVPLFILMGELLFHSGAFVRAIDTLDKWMGRIPGRLCLLSVGGATLFSTLSGSSMGTTAMLGSLLLPEMEKRGYHKKISIGACMAGSLAMIIPPSALAVILGSLAEVSIGKLLIAGLLPGFMIGGLYITYITLRCTLQPSIAPAYTPERVPWSEKIASFVKYVLPFGSIVFVVTGLIFAGLATPTESAGMGVVTTAILIVLYKRMNWNVIRRSVDGTLRITVMMFMILTGSTAFSQILAFTGASKGLVELVVSFDLSPFLVVVVMQALIVVLGTFMEQVSIMMITFPIFMPLVRALDFDTIWFSLLVLINMQIGMTTPPFGLCLFVMKGVAPPGTSMVDIYKSIAPFIFIDLGAMLIIMFFPSIALFLPSFMRY